jgi:SAM-dependent methyltransferase
MSMLASSVTLADRIVKRFGYRIFPASFLQPNFVDRLDIGEPAVTQAATQVECDVYLRSDNPRLLELRRLFASLDEDLISPLVWKERAAELHLSRFRGPSMWVYQEGHPNLDERAYLLATYYVLANDRLRLMERFTEDGAFGAYRLEIGGRSISRDLLDSILEIDFLDRTLGVGELPMFSILDIGAGYGRLAYRMLTAFTSLQNYFCADAVPESSFVCEYYLRFRGLQDRARIVNPLEIDSLLSEHKVDVAVNIHSFSECRLSAVQWWLRRLAGHGVRYLLVVPNGGDHGGMLLRNNIGQDMLPLFAENGYRLKTRQAKYGDAVVQKYALDPTYFWLFERSQ